MKLLDKVPRCVRQASTLSLVYSKPAVPSTAYPEAFLTNYKFEIH